MKRREIFFGVLGAVSSLILTELKSIPAQPKVLLPPLRVHPLPIFLAQWQTSTDQGDFFEAIKSTPVGYLIWSQFPVKVYLERPQGQDSSAERLRFQRWVEAVVKAVQEWNVYLPLVEVKALEQADIVIKRSHPARQVEVDPETGRLNIPRARSAQTSYQFYLKPQEPPVLSHRMTIELRPGMSYEASVAAARHELGHALGIWGHSQKKTDALYFSRISHSVPISARDINTLKKIYQQPTRLGWEPIIVK